MLYFGSIVYILNLSNNLIFLAVMTRFCSCQNQLKWVQTNWDFIWIWSVYENQIKQSKYTPNKEIHINFFITGVLLCLLFKVPCHNGCERIEISSEFDLFMKTKQSNPYINFFKTGIYTIDPISCLLQTSYITLNNTYKCAHINGLISSLILVRSFSNFQQK